MVDGRAAVATEDRVDQLLPDGGVVSADAIEVGHALGTVLLDDLLVMEAFGGRAHRVADQAPQKASVDLVTQPVRCHFSVPFLVHSERTQMYRHPSAP